MLYRILIIFVAFCMGCANALKIEINKGQVKPDPIAVVDFYDEHGRDSETGTEICSIIKRDLEFSGLFLPLNSNVFLESKETLCNVGPNIKNWNVLNTRFLVHGKVSKSVGNFSVAFDLVDVVTGQKMLSLTVEGNQAKLRRVAHVIADYIYERITNEKGYFNTNIVYVVTSFNKVSSKRRTRLVKVDQDGFNPRRLTDGSELVLTPRYANDAKTIAFISYRDKATDALGKSAYVYIMDSDSGKKRLMVGEGLMKELLKKNRGNPVRMTYAPRFAPDKQGAVLAIIIDGESSIYSINFANSNLKQLTNHAGVEWHSKDGSRIDTSPCYSPDGSKIVFTSNRQGREALYTMNADGSDIKRISNGDGRSNYSQPVWSPRGDLIAFAKQVGKEFYIGVMKPDGAGERAIARGYLVEAPCWSSNGRYLTYSTEAGPGIKSAVAVVDITGVHIRIIETKGDASYPAWSPTVGVKSIETQKTFDNPKEIVRETKEASIDENKKEAAAEQPSKTKTKQEKTEGFLQAPASAKASVKPIDKLNHKEKNVLKGAHPKKSNGSAKTGPGKVAAN